MRMTLFLLAIMLFESPMASYAVEVAPRISDREIIESLGKLAAGQANLDKRLDDLNRSMDKRFDDMNESINNRFEQVDKRLDDLNRSINNRFEQVDKRFEQIDKRFEDVNRRMDGLQNTMLALFGAILSLIVALFGYIIWDRRTMLRPVVDRLDRLEREVTKDLDLLNEEGSRLTRLVKTLREHAKSDPKLAEILRTFSLL